MDHLFECRVVHDSWIKQKHVATKKMLIHYKKNITQWFKLVEKLIFYV